METRKITIANTRDQKKSVIMTAATTLGELKRDLDNAGINYAEMDFIEALTKTQLRGDNSVLPHDVPYNHTTTNELVFLLTLPNRKIKSGSREDVYERINGGDDSDELKAAIHNHFGKNYTIVTTADLENFLNAWDSSQEFNEEIPMENSTTLPYCDDRFVMLEKKVDNLIEAMMNVIDVLDENDVETSDIYSALTDGIKVKDNTVYSAGMSSDDIDELIASVD